MIENVPMTRAKTYDEQVLELLGDPVQLDREMQEFGESEQFLNSHHKEFVKRYPDQWVGIYRGKLIAHALALEDVIAKLRKRGVPPGRALVRFMATKRRKMFL